MAGLRGSAAPSLSAWRGRSGRRYVVGVHDLVEAELAEIGEAVVIAVRRDEAGIAEAVAIAAVGRGARERLHRNWLARARQSGATEMHVHRLAESEEARRAVVTDLAADADLSAA
ncbi:hypothetical protein MPAR168_16035 [Methylorubrum populi]|uniref:Uncharacterized protein n=2 Tax=Hyphomicrobiales TaxID=356 RepID=A0ABU7T459_9HYPH